MIGGTADSGASEIALHPPLLCIALAFTWDLCYGLSRDVTLEMQTLQTCIYLLSINVDNELIWP